MARKRILFVIPDERKIYGQVFVKAGRFDHLPSLAFAVLGAVCKQKGYEPKILDLTLFDDPAPVLVNTLKDFRPAYVGFTCTSGLFFQVVEAAKQVKETDPGIQVLLGGPHAGATVEQTLAHDCFDYVFTGEGEVCLARFLQGDDRHYVAGLAFRTDKGKIKHTPHTDYIKNLDDFPFPDYSLYDLDDYQVTRLHSRHNPSVWIETSRGCPFDCKICNKQIHGQNFRPKSAQRVLDEMEHLVSMGIRGFHIADDGFTSNLKRAEAICDGIVDRKMDISWACTNGVRVDRVNPGLLEKMRRAGCYRVAFGIESGNQAVLDHFGKKTTLDQVENAVRWARQAGIETFGYFILGFLQDTPRTMADTLSFARQLPLDLAKVSLLMPFPGSPLHREYSERKMIFPPGDYRRYNIHQSPGRVYRHPTLDWEVIETFQKKFYRNFYFDPGYLLRRFFFSMKNKMLMLHLKAALSTDWLFDPSKEEKTG